MQLIGMLDSPYVRRVAISLKLLGLPFEHRSISVFRQFGVGGDQSGRQGAAPRRHVPRRASRSCRLASLRP